MPLKYPTNYQKLAQYLPEKALDYVVMLVEKHPVKVIITKERRTKHGDFRAGIGRQPTLTVNHNLNQYAFLITFLHELAHYKVYKKYMRRRQPHGKEWKIMFQELMEPVLDNQVFPEELQEVLVTHMRNPKASTSSDVLLVKALRQFDPPKDSLTLDDLELGNLFEFHGKTFKLGEKRRTRYTCREVNTNRIYTINQLAEVTKIG